MEFLRRVMWAGLFALPVSVVVNVVLYSATMAHAAELFGLFIITAAAVVGYRRPLN